MSEKRLCLVKIVGVHTGSVLGTRRGSGVALRITSYCIDLVKVASDKNENMERFDIICFIYVCIFSIISVEVIQSPVHIMKGKLL